MKNSSYKIGVDGGGTKTELILVDSSGAIVAQHRASGCNPSQVGAEKARGILQAALTALLSEARITLPSAKISETHLYMAGSPLFWRETADALGNFGRVTTGADSLPVLELGTSGGPGLVLHAGTGSFVTARTPDGTVHYAGGLGWKFGDAGSGFDLGRRAIASALLELQARDGGHGSISPLAEALCAHTQRTEYAEISRYFYSDPESHAKIAAFAPQVLALAEQDCGPAQQALADSLTELARLAHHVMYRLFPDRAAGLPCGISGRILNSPPAAYALRSLAEKLQWTVKLHFITTPPIEGVRRLLAGSAAGGS